jgi:predicted dehydrogenase
MAIRRLGIVMFGVTGRMGLNQHLVRSILAIRERGGVLLSNGDRVMPDPILVGRNADKIAALARQYGVERYTTDLDAALKNSDDEVFFDAATTQMRADLLARAIAAGKHVYCEKPVANSLDKASAVAKLAKAKRVKNGVVKDKLFLPGLRKIRMLRDSGFFGRMFAVRGEFGYWVFEGDWGQPAQRPSWNYRKADGGGIILDMLCHWRYVLDNLFGKVQAVSCLGATHVPKRIDESGAPYDADADDAAYATFQLQGGVIAQINSSWDVRVRRDDLLTFQVDGTHGSAVAVPASRSYFRPRLRRSGSIASRTRPRMSWRTRLPTSILGMRPRSTGKRPSPFGTTCGISDLALPKPWTRRSAAAGSSGPMPRN